ncbi:MAG: hypothetical protein ACXWTL_08125 [Methylobacter sp.]
MSGLIMEMCGFGCMIVTERVRYARRRNGADFLTVEFQPLTAIPVGSTYPQLCSTLHDQTTMQLSISNDCQFTLGTHSSY